MIGFNGGFSGLRPGSSSCKDRERRLCTGGTLFFDGEGALDEILEEAIDALTIAFARLLISMLTLPSFGGACWLMGPSRGEFRGCWGRGTGSVALGLLRDRCSSLKEPLYSRC